MRSRLSDLLSSNKTKSKLSLEKASSRGSNSPLSITKKLTAQFSAGSAKRFKNRASKIAATQQSRESAFGYYRMKKQSPLGKSMTTIKNTQA